LFAIQKQPAPEQTGPEGYPRVYSQTAVLGDAASPHPFRRSLLGIAVGPEDGIYALGDGEITAFEPSGERIRSWKAPDGAACLAVGPDHRIYIGTAGRVTIHDPSGSVIGSFSVGEVGRPALITSIKVHRKEVFVADAGVRFIRRFDVEGKQLATIGTQSKTGTFMLPNRHLDFDIDPKGVVLAADSGRHRVSSWALDGRPLGYFGRFGQFKVEDFVGCCNPVNLAVAPDGLIVTAEKVAARLKVFEPGGKLMAVIGPGPFDPMCTFIHLAVDSRGRVLAADPVRREIMIFSPDARPDSAGRPEPKTP
jgi:sugar lactone lactonase YvrE